MTENIDRVNDFDKGSITLELPGSLHEAVRRLGLTLMPKAAENRDDGARGL